MCVVLVGFFGFWFSFGCGGFCFVAFCCLFLIAVVLSYCPFSCTAEKEWVSIQRSRSSS